MATPRFVIVRATASLIAMALVATGAFFGIRYLKHQSETLDQLEAAREESAEARKSLQDGRPGAGAVKPMDAARARLNATALAADSRKINAAAEKISGIYKQKNEDYEKAYVALKDAGMVRSASFSNPASIHQREELVKRFEAANATLEETLQSIERTMRTELDKQGLSEQQSKNAADSFTEATHVNTLLEMRACDRDLASEFLKILDLLDRRWGTWSPAPSDKVEFKKEADADSYNAIRGRLLEINAHMEALQKQLTQNQNPPQLGNEKSPGAEKEL